MTHQNTKEDKTQALAILAVREGRELGDEIANFRRPPTADLPRPAISSTLRRLQVGDVTDGRDLTTLEALRRGLEESLLQEITGTKAVAHPVGYDQDGESLRWETVPVYTDRGEQVRALYERLEYFLEARQRLLDQANAERLAMRLLR